MAPPPLAAALLAAMFAAAAAQQQGQGVPVPAPAAARGGQLPSIYRVLTLGRYKQRNQQLTCPDPKTKLPGCTASCDSRCPDQCIVVCPGCKTYCICDFYPGTSCGDPRFTGGDGNTFYFHGKKDHDFCVFTDAGLHINAHFIGNHNAATSRDFTWIQALGVRFLVLGGAGADDGHRLYLGAQNTTTNRKWDSDVDRLELAFDGERVAIPPHAGAAWRPAAAPALTVTRTAAANGVRVRLQGVLDVVANVVPVSDEDSRVHAYGVPDGDSLAHLDLGFRFLDLTGDDVHGVLGQTYRSDYVSRLSASSRIPVMGGAAQYLSSDIFATDCAVARFGDRRARGVSMLTAATAY